MASSAAERERCQRSAKMCRKGATGDDKLTLLLLVYRRPVIVLLAVFALLLEIAPAKHLSLIVIRQRFPIPRGEPWHLEVPCSHTTFRGVGLGTTTGGGLLLVVLDVVVVVVFGRAFF
jgi:hypothetical protein